MTSFLVIIKKIPVWGWIAIAVLIFLAYQALTGWAMSSKLFNMALDNLRNDQTKVVKTLEENQAMYETEIGRLNAEVQTLKQKQAAAAAESQRLKGLIGEKDAQIAKLQREREAIVVSGDPDSLLNDLHNLGYKSAYKRIGSPGR